MEISNKVRLKIFHIKKGRVQKHSPFKILSIILVNDKFDDVFKFSSSSGVSFYFYSVNIKGGR